MIRSRFGFFLCCALLVGLGAGVAKAAGVHINHTPSLPGTFYRAVRGGPTVGALVRACVPDPYAELARERGYVVARGWSRCPQRLEPIGKQVAAGPGDRIAWVGDTVITVNGVPLPHTAPLGRDRRGRPLAAYPWRGQVLREGEFYLHSEHHTGSFDSRYFGPVPRRLVSGILKPLHLP